MGEEEKSRRLRSACFHEAGHCVARWHFGYETDIARILSEEERCFGVTIGNGDVGFQSEGILEGQRIIFESPRELKITDARASRAYRAQGEIRAAIALVVAVAGPIAEAKYRKKSLSACLLMAGLDLEIARLIISHWLPDSRTAMDSAIEKAAALLNCKFAWNAVEAIADRLLDNGVIVQEEIDMFCKFAFEREMAWMLDWDRAWPPTSEQLRWGIAPQIDSTRAEQVH